MQGGQFHQHCTQSCFYWLLIIQEVAGHNQIKVQVNFSHPIFFLLPFFFFFDHFRKTISPQWINLSTNLKTPSSSSSSSSSPPSFFDFLCFPLFLLKQKN
ncbi:hypothetical protein NE237_033298 [Protea cynaroides]|uniref:Uncharacterized protein n=1 Tax=Protea cynaroides TaxID=273540 RepID=A0A9Q0L729_9MAGN|nr:hypothetical protein NE237_033298 [Protea cynaroides]